MFEWSAERHVDATLAADLIGAQFPALRGATVEPLAEGWDNTVYVVGGRWAFRFPRRAIALPGVEREVAVLSRVARLLPLPVPEPEFVGQPSGRFPWLFWGAPLLAGRELADAGMSDADRVDAAAGVGDFLRVLHGLPIDVVADVRLPVDPMRRADAGHRVASTRDRLEALVAQGIWTWSAEVEALLDEAVDVRPSAAQPVLVHGDLHSRHLLVDSHGRAAAVIDWGDVCLADPAVDLSLGYAAFSGAARSAFLSAYGGIDAERELRARVLAVSLCAALAQYAAGEGFAGLQRESLSGLRRAVSE